MVLPYNPFAGLITRNAGLSAFSFDGFAPRQTFIGGIEKNHESHTYKNTVKADKMAKCSLQSVIPSKRAIPFA